MTPGYRGLAAGCCVWLAIGVALAAQNALADFARGAQIRMTRQGPVVRVLLPEVVYTTVTRADLADIRVFNGAGETVPHALRHATAPEAAATVFVGVPFFPLRQTAANETLLTQVAVGPSGAIVEVRGGAPATDEIVGYLIDATTAKLAVDRLSLEWEAPEGMTFLARVSVEASNDLTLWTSVASGTAIARLLYGDRQLTQADIDLAGAALSANGVRYLRLSWPKELAGVRLTGARLRPRGAAPAPEIAWTARTGVAGENGVVAYDTGGHLPVEFLDLEFADDTDVTSVEVQSRPDADAAWRFVYVGAFFTAIRDGSRVHNPPARVPLNGDRLWQIRATRQGGWQAGRAPRLRFGWHAHELLFVPRGQAPFTLAFGSTRAENAAAPIDALLVELGTPDQLARPEPATLEQTRDLAGEAALTSSRPLRRMALWGVLVAAVLALGALVARAARDMKRE
jgi:hypothetical protein